MAENLITKIVEKIPLPPLPEFTNDAERDLELLQAYKKNLEIYKSALDFAEKNIFSTAITNSRNFRETRQKLETIFEKLENDKQRLAGGLSVKAITEYLGCENSTKRISKQQLIENSQIISNMKTVLVEDNNNSVFILQLGKENQKFSITECPCCDKITVPTRDELMIHIKSQHITCYKYKSRFVPANIEEIREKIVFEEMNYEPSAFSLSKLTSDIEEIFISNDQFGEFEKFKDAMIEHINSRLIKHFPNCELKKYGSSLSGFGLKGSDIDLCLIIDLKSAFKHPKFFKEMSKEYSGDQHTNDLCEWIILSKLCNVLAEGSNKVIDLELRSSARVRIVNFKTPTEPQFEVDICLNNRIALENTELLRTYSLIDERVSKIGIIVKMWAKAVNICNTRNGTLSAYAYVILVIYFLQNISEPVLPCLQANATHENIIDGHNCSFDKDYRNYIPLAKKNMDSEGSLLLDFFKFYAFFD